tara:strand:+ start:343 stop:474 length:132 start_codon:yes stop_codon:yes gene_type:complete
LNINHRFKTISYDNLYETTQANRLREKSDKKEGILDKDEGKGR